MQRKVAIITGGATGIGKGIVEKFAKEDYRVILCYNSSEDDAIKLKMKYNNVETFKLDVTSEKNIKKLSSLIDQKYKNRLHCIVNNAGGNISFAPTHEYTSEDWDRTFNLNCKSIFLMSKYLNPMLEKDGSIVNISSISALSGGAPGGMAYAASKSAVDCMTKSLAKELAHKNINVNSVSPGIVYTNQHKQFSTEKYYNTLIDKVPLRRDGKANDIANLVNFLVSKEGEYITGQIIGINGGMLMR